MTHPWEHFLKTIARLRTTPLTRAALLSENVTFRQTFPFRAVARREMSVWKLPSVRCADFREFPCF